MYNFKSYHSVHAKLAKKNLNILWAELLYSSWNLNLKVRLQKVVQMNIKHFTQLFLQLFIDGYEYYYYGLNAFMCIWITTLSLLQGYQRLTIRNPRWTQDQLLSPKQYAESFWKSSNAALSNTACSKVQLAYHFREPFIIFGKQHTVLSATV